MVSAHRDAISPYNKQTVDVMIKHETEAQKNHHNPLHGITTRSDAAMWPLRLSLIQKKTTQPSWRLREPLAQRCSTVGVGGGPVSLCVMLTSTTSLPVQLYRQTFSARKVRCFPTPPRISFRSGGGEKPMWRENSPNPWYNWNSFRWCEILRKGGVNTPVNEAGYSEPWQT